ncbi:hypothetical protein JCM3774_005204 [Rhodotorula dairenensis]
MVRFAFAVAIVASASSHVLANSLDRRQTLSNGGSGGNGMSEVEGLMSLATNVANDIVNGNATSACSSWVSTLQACSPDPSTANPKAVAVCACGSGALDALSSCAPSYGATGISQATGFSTFCTQTLPNLVGSASVSAPASTSSSAHSSSMVTSTRSGAASTSSPAASATSSSVAGIAANQAPASTSTSGAGRINPLSGALAAGVMSLLAALAF